MENLTWEHFRWATERRDALDAVREEMGHTPSTTMTVYRLDGDLVEECVEVLLTYLQGSAAPPQRPEEAEFSPDELVGEFTDAYFSGDKDTIRRYLSSDYRGSAVTYPFDAALIVTHTTKGLHDICHMEEDAAELMKQLKDSLNPFGCTQRQ